MTEQTSERVARATDQTSERVLSWLLIGEWLTLSLLKCHMDVTMTSMNQCCRLIQSERVHSYGMGAAFRMVCHHRGHQVRCSKKKERAGIVGTLPTYECSVGGTVYLT